MSSGLQSTKTTSPSRFNLYSRKQGDQGRDRASHPKMTAFQSKMLLSCGAPLTPAGGSCCNLLKSRINLFLAGVDILPYPPCFLTKKVGLFTSLSLSRSHTLLLLSPDGRQGKKADSKQEKEPHSQKHPPFLLLPFVSSPWLASKLPNLQHL